MKNILFFIAAIFVAVALFLAGSQMQDSSDLNIWVMTKHEQIQQIDQNDPDSKNWVQLKEGVGKQFYESEFAIYSEEEKFFDGDTLIVFEELFNGSEFTRKYFVRKR